MILGGLQKTTLIDFPGRIACTVFTVGCNFRCPFCHNKDLVSQELFKKSGIESISEEYFFEFLKKRKKILDGVCITGGEPTIWKDLPHFCQKIKDLGLEVKLDSQGSNPKVLEGLINNKLIDFIAMDVKSSLDEEYLRAIGRRLNRKSSAQKKQRKNKDMEILNLTKKSIKIILKSGLEYEFRTTMVPKIHNKAIMVKLVKDLKRIIGPRQYNYYIQSFRPKNCLDPEYLKIEPYNEKQMEEVLSAVRKVLPKTKLRGNSE